MPIYSIDARSRPLDQSLHWSELGSRAHFDLGLPEAGLVLEDVTPKDQGLYRCRVDFGTSPTRNVAVKLLVVVPPRRLSILGGSGLEVSGVVGPYALGGSLSLTCHATAGWPRPRVTWWHEDSLLDDEVDEVRGQVTRNILVLARLTREDLHRVLTCRATNSNLTSALTTSVTLDMTFPPLEVSLSGVDSALREGRRHALACEAAGSRPPADLTWWVDGVQVIHTNYQVLQEGNVSRSTLVLWPSRSHDGAVVSCRADNPLLQAAALEDSTKLLVYYSPRLQLLPGHNLDITTIKEGDDVYFDCHIQANPRVSVVQWFLDGRELRQNVSGGVIQSNQSLVLQNVRRTSSGLYICRATNLHGSASSNALQLSVKYAPVCAAGQKWVYGGGRLHPVNVTCRVEAYPEALRFRWAFNTSSEFLEIPQDHISSSRSRSLLTYTPETNHDFGSLLCWGLNSVDAQREPCVFHVVPAGVPEPVSNCSARQEGSGSVAVLCLPGWGGGLPQTFTLEVLEAPAEGLPSPAPTARLVAALRDRREPRFAVRGLLPGREYLLAVVAANARGAAPPAVLAHLAPIDVAEKRTSAVVAGGAAPPPGGAVAPIMGGVAGVAATLAACSVALVLAARARALRRDPTPVAEGGDDGGFLRQRERGPDVILIEAGVSRDDMQWQDAAVSEAVNDNCHTEDLDLSCDGGVNALRDSGPCRTAPFHPREAESRSPGWSWGFASLKDLSFAGLSGGEGQQVRLEKRPSASDLAEAPLLACAGHRGSHETSV